MCNSERARARTRARAQTIHESPLIWNANNISITSTDRHRGGAEMKLGVERPQLDQKETTSETLSSILFQIRTLFGKLEQAAQVPKKYYLVQLYSFYFLHNARRN